MEKKTKITIGLIFLFCAIVSFIFSIMPGLVLWQLGITPNPLADSVAPSGCIGFVQIVPLNNKLDTDTDTLTIVLSNDAGTQLTLNTVTAAIGTENPAAVAPAVNLTQGERYTVKVTGFTSPKGGKYYSANLTIKYTNPLSGTQRQSTGSCWGTAE